VQDVSQGSALTMHSDTNILSTSVWHISTMPGRISSGSAALFPIDHGSPPVATLVSDLATCTLCCSTVLLIGATEPDRRPCVLSKPSCGSSLLPGIQFQIHHAVDSVTWYLAAVRVGSKSDSPQGLTDSYRDISNLEGDVCSPLRKAQNQATHQPTQSVQTICKTHHLALIWVQLRPFHTSTILPVWMAPCHDR